MNSVFVYSLLIYSKHQKINKVKIWGVGMSEMDLSLGFILRVDNESWLSWVSLKSELQCDDLDAGSLFSN